MLRSLVSVGLADWTHMRAAFYKTICTRFNTLRWQTVTSESATAVRCLSRSSTSCALCFTGFVVGNRLEALRIWAGRTHPGKITHVVWAENTHVSKRYPPFWHAATRTRKEDQIPSKVNPKPRAYRNQRLSVGTPSSSALPFRGGNVIQKQTAK